MNLGKYDQLAFFKGLSDVELDLIGPFFAPQNWVAGTVVFEQGDRADYLYLVVSGELTIHYKPDDGPSMVLTHIQPGGIFGWSAAMGNRAYTSGAVCTLDCEVLRIRGADLRNVCDKHPELGKVILERLAANIAQRQHGQQGRVNTILTNGLRQLTNG